MLKRYLYAGVQVGVHEQVHLDTMYVHNMQKWLHDACLCMRFQPPMYTLHDTKDFDGFRYYRYQASLITKTIGKIACITREICKD